MHREFLGSSKRQRDRQVVSSYSNRFGAVAGGADVIRCASGCVKSSSLGARVVRTTSQAMDLDAWDSLDVRDPYEYARIQYEAADTLGLLWLHSSLS